MSMRKAFLALLLAASVTPAFAQDKTVDLKVSLWVPPAHPLQTATQAWAADIEKASGGTIKCRCFPPSSSARHSTITTWRATASPTSPMSIPAISPAASRSSAPASLPFLISDGKNGTLALNEWYHKYAAEGDEGHQFLLRLHPRPGALHSARRKSWCRTISRASRCVPAHSTIGEFRDLFGGTNVQASAPEARDAIERGVADDITFPWGSMLLFGIDKATKYPMDVPLYSRPSPTTSTWTNTTRCRRRRKRSSTTIARRNGRPGQRPLERIRVRRPRQDEGGARP